MNFEARGTVAAAARRAPSDPRTATVIAAAEEMYGTAWPYQIAATFGVSPEEVEDWAGERAAVPDFFVAALLRAVRLRADGRRAVGTALAEEIAAAPEGDYSFPGGLLRNARVLIRVRTDDALFDEEGRIAPEPAARGPRPALHLVGGLDADPARYIEPRVGADDRI